MIFPCAQEISECAPCTDFPIINTSAETPDSDPFIGIYWQPTTNGTFFAPTCKAVCTSLVSQEEADLCAQRDAVDCSLGGSPRTGNPWPHGAPPGRFRSSVQECSADCGDGNSTTVVEPLGTVVSYTQADADARAHALACKRAKELLVCFVTASPLAPIHANQFASIPIVATGGTGDYEFTVVGGSLPAGMSFDAVGLLFGTPTGSGTSTFSVTVADSAGGTATKAFSIEILAACNAATNWCTNPGTCRLRIQNFQLVDWPGVMGCDTSSIAAWDGKFALTYQTALPCKTYDGISATGATPSIALNYDPLVAGGTWQLSFDTVEGTLYFANGPNDPSPLGTYTKDPMFSCTGPNSLVVESYAP